MADISEFLKRLDEQVTQAKTRVEQKQSEIQQSYEGAPNGIRPSCA